jgi:hypothetical protein
LPLRVKTKTTSNTELGHEVGVGGVTFLPRPAASVRQHT